MAKNRLILHIGTHKTATSTLQLLMSHNKGELAEQGYLYARTDREPLPHNNKHAFFGRIMVKGGEPWADLHRSMVDEMETSGCHTMIVSEEGLAGPPMSRDLTPLALFAKDFDIEVVCYVRRQDYFAESFWNQGCKMGKETLSIGGFIQKPNIVRYMTYHDMLDRWGQYGKVTAIGFETARDAGIVETFAKATGMVLPPAEKTRNVSPSMTLAAALAVLNRVGKTPKRWQALEPLLGPELSKTAMGSRMRTELLARFAEHNQRLKANYGVEFPDTMPEEPVEPLEELTADAAVRLVRALQGVKKDRDGVRKKNPARRKKNLTP